MPKSDDLRSVGKEASREAKDRDNAKESAREHDRAKGEEPDSDEKMDEARRDVDWDAASEHADKGGKFTK